MTADVPRGIVVVDAGATNTKIVLFDSTCRLLAERRFASRHVEGPPYRWIDPEPVVAAMREALPELDRILPVDAVVPCAHGAALACLDAGGGLALPIMDYTAEPPAAIVHEYERIKPPFAEVCCPLLPMALTHALQLYWQARAFPGDFANVKAILPYIQYVGYRLSGRAVAEVTSMSCQTQLVDVVNGGPSSLARAQGWAKLFPPYAKAWEAIGDLNPEFRPAGFRGRGLVLAGIHDSSANYVRYLAGGFQRFTLLSTGTWIIGFDTTTGVEQLREDYDTATNTDIFGRTVATSRFYGGREHEILAGEAAPAPSLALLARLVEQRTLALPSFSAAPGPMPSSGLRGRIAGPEPRDAAERSALAALYCALMVSEQLDAVASRNPVIVDGPFATNDVFLAVLAALRASQNVSASELRDGTTAGAACLALMADEKLPRVDLGLRPVTPAAIAGLAAYHTLWKENADANCR
jgi:sugar (pentulose or hexulose) kinase